MPSVAWPPSFPAGTQWSTRLPSARSRRTGPARPARGSTDRGSRTPAWLRCAKAAFTAVLEGRPNQFDRLREDVHVTAERLLDVAATPGEVTEAGLRNNVSVGIQYLASWLHGTGAVAIFNLMQDTAQRRSRARDLRWAVSCMRLKMATAPVPCNQDARYWIPTLTLLRSPASVTSPGVAATSSSRSAVT